VSGLYALCDIIRRRALAYRASVRGACRRWRVPSRICGINEGGYAACDATLRPHNFVSLSFNVATGRLRNVIVWTTGCGLLVAVAILSLPPTRWRSVIVARKLLGVVQDLSWADLGDIAGPGSSVQLRRLAITGDPYRSVHDPYSSAQDRAAGQRTFELICAKCHGTDARGGLGPALIGRTLSHGDSDWAVYRTITRGVPGSPMEGGLVSRREAWFVMAYLRGLGAAPAARLTGAAGTVASLAPAHSVSFAELVHSSGGTGDWLMPGGAYDGQRFARDRQINLGNVSQLAVRWIHQFPSTDAPNESAPIVSGDYLYVTLPSGSVFALDAHSGTQVWQYSRQVPSDIRVCCVATNRGAAVLGNRVYVGTLDAHLLALDASSGRLVWDRPVADYRVGYSITAAPLAVRDLVITGIAGAEYPTRGFISAYDAATGALRWRFNTIPQPGDPGSNTWGGDSWKTGGAVTWGTGAYDPELNLLYWGVSGAAPDFDAQARPGDNLYSNCMLALDATTGKLAWYFQFLPGDDHDWDSIQTPSLIDVSVDGHMQRWLAVANRGGFFYVLDRTNGHFVRGAPFAKQTWALGLTDQGQPILNPKSAVSPKGTFIYPSVNGATNWWPSTYSPITGLYYVNVEESGGLFFSGGGARPRPGRFYIDGLATYGDSFADYVRAIDPKTATVRWGIPNTTVTSAPRGGLLATAGGLLFGSDGAQLYALDAASGAKLWSFDTGAHISAPPVTFRSQGEQIIAVVAGQDLIAFALPSKAY
jgi:alcohol dehydrogenase (cytochrome c)